MNYRSNMLLPESRVGAGVEQGSGYKVIAYQPGGVVLSVNGTQVTVAAGHFFEVNDKLIRWVNALSSFDPVGERRVTAINGNVLTLDTFLNAFALDKLVNIGADTGPVGSPLWNGSRLSIYADPGGNFALNEARMITGPQGNYEYYHSEDAAWELLIDPDNAPVGIAIFQQDPDVDPGAVGTVAANANAIPANSTHSLEVLDASGNVIGYVPVFDTEW